MALNHICADCRRPIGWNGSAFADHTGATTCNGPKSNREGTAHRPQTEIVTRS